MRILRLETFHGFDFYGLVTHRAVGVDGEGVQSPGAKNGFVEGGLEDEIGRQGFVGDGVEGLRRRGKGRGVLGCDERFPFFPGEIDREGLVGGRT